jgi:hypothetical protein
MFPVHQFPCPTTPLGGVVVVLLLLPSVFFLGTYVGYVSLFQDVSHVELAAISRCICLEVENEGMARISSANIEDVTVEGFLAEGCTVTSV